MNSVSTCLDRIWAREFADVDLSFSPTRRVFSQRRVRDRRCGLMPSKGSIGTYCGGSSPAYFVIVEDTTADPRAVALVAGVVAHEYAHHVQALSGIIRYKGMAKKRARTRRGKDLIQRRLELQAECFAGVAVHAMRKNLPPWSAFRDQYFGTVTKQTARDHGRLKTQLRWLEKGFHSGKPGACDTWSPPARDVT
jgi:predicted metalloprotease